jgi:integrase
MPLTDSTLRSAKPREKQYKLYDEDGLYVLITPTGGRLWRFKYIFDGVEKGISLGKYPDVPLKLARDRRDDARRQVAAETDPSTARKAKRAERANDLRTIADEWLGKQKSFEPKTVARIRDRLAKWILPTLGGRPINQIQPVDLLPLLQRAEAAGLHETAHRTRADISRVFRYAVATGRADRDITVDLRGALTPVRATNFAAITEPSRVGALLRSIDGYRGQPVTVIALKLAPLVFVRPGELRAAEWSEFDFDAAEWRIPGPKTKMRRPHVVPLSKQALALIEDLKAHTGDGKYLFPALRDPNRPMSENTLNACLRSLGYRKDEMTSHGFRSIASTLLREMGIGSDLIEKQLAHQDQNAVRNAYDRSERMTERRAMMQKWANHLDKLRASKA